MDYTVLSVAATIVVVGIIGTMKFFERKYGNNPEAWDNNKFLTFLGIAVIVIAIEYYFGSAIQFPAEELINQAAAVFGLATALLAGGRIVKRGVVPAVTGTAPVTGTWSAGFTATPVFTEGKSPCTVTFHLVSGAPAADHPGTVAFEIDWMDGTPVQRVPAVNGFAQVSHTFTYVQGGSQYTGHSFYPEFTTVSSDGSRQSFNVEGKMVEVEVQS